MSIRDFLSPDHVSVDVRVSEKTKLLRELARRAAEAIDVPAERIYAELQKREELGSTGTGGGVAIPHARLPEVKKPFGMLFRLAQPIQFDAIDDKPVDVMFLLLLPSTSAGEQLNALASVARKLRDPAALLKLRQAGDAAALFRAISQ
jgi:nitrogen PTS system EIIA component